MLITIEGPRDWSPGDEDAFFHWLNSITSIRSRRGVGLMLELNVVRRRISDRDLRELNALCERYQISAEPLSLKP